MSDTLSSLTASDPRWADRSCTHFVELATATGDQDLVGVGSSPYLGDLGRTGIAVPTAPTTAQNQRYLFRLCGVEIPSEYAIMIRGIRQLATIRHEETINDFPLVVEREIVSPLWSFLDGNISWHLRWQKNQFSSKRADAVQVGGTSPQMRGLGTALLYIPPLLPYQALGGGIPPGTAIHDLGTWRDIRYPWSNTQVQWAHGILIKGPGAVVMYASVNQTDASIRPIYPDVRGMRPEDQFVSNFRTTARYGRVAGGMMFELMPACAKRKM